MESATAEIHLVGERYTGLFNGRPVKFPTLMGNVNMFSFSFTGPDGKSSFVKISTIPIGSNSELISEFRRRKTIATLAEKVGAPKIYAVGAVRLNGSREELYYLRMEDVCGNPCVQYKKDLRGPSSPYWSRIMHYPQSKLLFERRSNGLSLFDEMTDRLFDGLVNNLLITDFDFMVDQKGFIRMIDTDNWELAKDRKNLVQSAGDVLYGALWDKAPEMQQQALKRFSKKLAISPDFSIPEKREILSSIHNAFPN